MHLLTKGSKMRSFCLIMSIFFGLGNFCYSEENIHPHGYWCGKDIMDQHRFDPYLANALGKFFIDKNAKTIVDFGCGIGDYVKHLRSLNLNCEGYDGNPVTYELTGGIANIIDLSQPFNLDTCFDWVLCLEVGEHLPQCYESILIENLDKHNSQGIILSWAVKGQGGFGHFNEQDNDYIKDIMLNLGYSNDEFSERTLRDNSSLPWFKNTIMVFRKIINE